MTGNRYQPAILGGLLIGILSGLPFVEIGNACCCLWVVTGGLMATYLRQQQLQDPMETSDAVLTGLTAGVVGAVLVLILKLIVPQDLTQQQEAIDSVLSSNPELPPWFSTAATRMTTGPGFALFSFAINLPLFAFFSMLGALLGLSFFRKKPLSPPSA
jgi:hypothetical protein